MKPPRQLLLLIVVILLQIKELFSQRADFKVPENQLNRRFSWSSRAPLAKAINDLAPEVIPTTALITRHASRVERAVLDSLTRDRLVPKDIVQPCDPKISRKYRSSIFRGFALQGYPEPAWNCGSDVRGVRMKHDEEPGYTFDDLFEAMFNQGVAIKRIASEIAARVIQNYTDPDVRFNFNYRTASANCVLQIACLYRKGEYWHQGLAITSNKKEDHLRDGFRSLVSEHLRVVDGKLGDPLMMRLPVYDNGTIERVILDNTTTIIQAWRGPANPSCFRLIPMEENPAVLDALDHTDHSSQLAEDALTSSNLAIILLPLGLNLVPLSLFADASTVTLLLYTIMSDILTVVPLAIKGVELVVIDMRRFRSVMTRMLSPALGNLTVPLAAGGEIWGAECRVREGIGRTGIILIIVSLIFLLFGIGAELLARRFLLSRKKILESQNLDSERSELVGFVSKATSTVISISEDEAGTGDVKSRYSSDLG